MKGEDFIKRLFAKSALFGAVLTALCGLLLWGTPLGNRWENVSYDLLFNFGTRATTNPIVIIQMDTESYDSLHQDRNNLWDRNLHTQLINKLTDDGARLVVFDVLFKKTNNPTTDANLAAAIRRNGKVILMADVADLTRANLASASEIQPHELFRTAAAKVGVGHVDADTGQIARHHWPFIAPGEGAIHSLGWAAAAFLGAPLDLNLSKQWLRYYGKSGPGKSLSYRQALLQPAGFFRDKIIFIGSWPNKPDDPGLNENDKFRTPFTRWNGKAVGGVEIIATTFSNLMNGDWLRRLPAWMDLTLLSVTGIVLGLGFCQLKPLASLFVAGGLAVAVMFAFVAWSYFTNDWFPWLVIAGGQVPVALVWSWISRPEPAPVLQPRYPGYTPIDEPFGTGAYGKVLRVLNVTGQFEALKEVQRSTFKDADPYEREFHGIKNYKPISHQHPGLLNIYFVNLNATEGFFYYVMELGDPLDPAWEQKGERYQSRDLDRVCYLESDHRLPVRECLRICITLLEALEFLHQHNLVHRDIKPSNIIFVNGRPKLADVGLVREDGPEKTNIGTTGYMPPAPEMPGSKLGDIYAMGMVLYVISTGNQPSLFPKLPPVIVGHIGFMQLNAVICRACQPEAEQRYASATEMRAALQAIQSGLDTDNTRIL